MGIDETYKRVLWEMVEHVTKMSDQLLQMAHQLDDIGKVIYEMNKVMSFLLQKHYEMKAPDE